MKRTSSSIVAGLLALCALPSLSACTLLQRSEGSGYAYRQALYDEGLGYQSDRKSWLRDQATNEIGIDDTLELSDEQREAVALRVRLKEAERQVVRRHEREQYFRHKPLMANDRERLKFLSLPSLEARARWLAARNISESQTKHPPVIQKLIEQNDITVGMTKQAVRDSWGEPELVEVAGNPIYGNERWRYLEEISSPEGYQTEARVIYFESGRVVGWETR